MDQRTFERLKERILRLQEHPDAKRLDAAKLERITIRMESFSRNDRCGTCETLLSEADERVGTLAERSEATGKDELKSYRRWLGTATAHLQQKHQLVPEGTYLAIYMSMGLSIGLVFGLTIFDNAALGMPIGMSIGLAIGAGLDADAKKKGKTI